MSTKICGYCGRKNADDAPACRECGTKFVSSGGDATGECKGLRTPALGQGSRRGFNHEWALAFATCHFALSLAIGVACLLYFWGTAMSDAFHSTPSWVNALFALLWFLQTPAAAVEAAALRHSQHGADWLLLSGLGALWSLALGYVVPWISQALRKEK